MNEITKTDDQAKQELVEQTDVAAAIAKALAPLKRSDAAIDQLAAELKGKTFDCTTKEGDKEARASKRVLVELRVGVEELRQQLKAPHLEAGRAIDAEAKRLTSRVLELEQPIAAVIDAEKARQDAIAAEQAAAEAARRKLQTDRIATMERTPLNLIGQTAAQIQEMLTGLEAQDFTDMDPDLAEQAHGVRQRAVGQVTDMLEQRVEFEAQQAALAEQRAQQEREQAEAKTRAEENRRRDQALQDIRDFGRFGPNVAISLDEIRDVLAKAEAMDLSHIHADDLDVAEMLKAQRVDQIRERVQLMEQRVEQDRVAAEQAAVAEAQAAAQRAAEEQERQRQQEAEREAQRQREEAERAAQAEARQQQEAEQARLRAAQEEAIRSATLVDASIEALQLLTETFGDNHATVRKLASAITRHQSEIRDSLKPAKAPRAIRKTAAKGE